MRTALTILAEELRRLKASGVATVSVSDESLGALRRALAITPRVVRAVGSGAPPAGAARSGAESGGPSDAAPRRKAAEGGDIAGGEAVRTGAGAARPAGRGDPAYRCAALPAYSPGAGKRERWETLRAHVLGDAECRRQVRPGKQVVFGVGSLDARIMFVGEAPGADEEVQGEPFVGPAGQLLTKMVQAMGLRREEVYIGNIMNFRPTLPLNAEGVQYGNRPPTAEEMAYCLPFLKEQVEIVQPEFLVALGATAAQGLLGTGAFRALSEVRGRWREFAGRPLMITYHPSYILRNPSNRSKRLIWEDLLQVMERAGLPVSDKQRAYFLG